MFTAYLILVFGNDFVNGNAFLCNFSSDLLKIIEVVLMDFDMKF